MTNFGNDFASGIAPVQQLSMQVSRRQLAISLGRIHVTKIPKYAPRRLNATQVASALHDSLGVRFPPNRKPIILPEGVGLAFNDLLATLRSQVDSDNAAGVWKTFSALRDAGHADNLSLSDLEQVDAVIASTILWLVSKPMPSILRRPSYNDEAPPPRKGQPVASVEQIHELALWLAVRGPICLLRASMIRALREPNPEVVLGLWQSYFTRCLAGEGAQFLGTASRSDVPSAMTRPTPSSDDPYFDQAVSNIHSQPNILRYHYGRPELLAFTICAHVMTNDFRGAFDTVYSTLIPLKSEIARDLLEPIREVREDVVVEALRYINDLNLLRSLARPWSFRNYLFNFVESRSKETVQSIYQEILRLLRAPDPWIGPLNPSSGIPSISPDPKSKPIFSLSRQTWCDLIEAADALRLPDLKQSIWEDFHSLGATPTSGMWNTLMLSYVRAGDLDKAYKVWETIGEGGRDVYTYTAMIQGLFDRHLLSDALKYFEEMKQKIPKKHIGIKTYNIVIHGFFINGREDAALELVSQLEANGASVPPTGPVPDISTYNSILRHYSKRRDMVSLSKVLRTIAESGLVPDVYTLTTILDALLTVGVQEAPSRILGVMKALGVEVNAAIVSVLIEDVVNHIPGRNMRRGRGHEPMMTDPRAMSRPPSEPQTGPLPRERLQTGVKMLVAFEDAGVKTNVVNYTSLMAAFHRAAGTPMGPQTISYVEAQRATQALRARMKKRKIHGNRVTYNILIAACLEGGNVPISQWRDKAGAWEDQDDNPMARPSVNLDNVPPNVAQAVRYFHEMRGAGILPDHDTWFILLMGVASHGQIPLARALCNELVKTGFRPQTSLLKLILQIKGGY
jgi:pentatricopeptide repeat protein